MQKPFIIVLVIGLTLLLIAGAMFFFLQQSRQTKVSQEQIPEALSKVEHATIKDWEIFESEKHGFRIEHPADWQIQETAEYVAFVTPQYDEKSLTIHTLRDTHKLDALNKFGFEQWQGRYYIKGRRDDFRAQVFFTSVNGKRAVVAPPISIFDLELNRFTTYPLKSVLIMESDRYALLTMELREETFDTMVGTFEFLPRIVDTSTWKVYENKEHGFSVSYPSNFEIEFDDSGNPGFYWNQKFTLLVFDPTRDPARGYTPPKVGKDGYRFMFFTVEQAEEWFERIQGRREDPSYHVSRIEKLPVEILGQEHVLFVEESLRSGTDEPVVEVYFPWQDGWIFASTVHYDKDVFREILATFQAR